MGSIKHTKCHVAQLVCLLSGLVFALPAAAESISGFEIERASTYLQSGVYNLDSRISYRLSDEVRDALHNGVEIVIALEIQVNRVRRYLPDDLVAELSQRYQINYHALTRQYLVTNLNSNARTSYPTLQVALNQLGNIEGLPILDQNLLRFDGEYLIRLRARLDIGALPAPMRLWTYLSGDWRLATPWKSWILQ